MKNQEKWREAIAWMQSNGGHVPAVVLDAVQAGYFNLRHKSFTNPAAKNVIFRGQHFKSKNDLLDRNFENSSSISKNLGDVMTEITSLDNCGAVERVSEAEALSEGSVISPILWIVQTKPDGSLKKRLIHHDLLNYTYSKPKFSLAKVSVELERLADFSEIRKCDKEKCFYQFPLSKENSKTLRFKIRTKSQTLYYQWKVMAMGMSAAPFVTQSTNGFLTELYSLTFKIYACVYLDDVWTEKRDEVVKFEEWAGEYGLRFKESKSEEGSRLELLGVELDLEAKTAKITSDKAANIEADSKLLLSTGTASSKQLAIYYGRLEFASQMCSLGRIHTQALTKHMGSTQIDLNKLSDSDEIHLSLKALDEVRFWSKISKHKPLQIGRKKYKNGNVLASDASQKRFAYVIGAKSFADIYPDKYANEHISIKEAYALFCLLQKASQPDTDIEVLCDNASVVNCFNKGRSKNTIIHDLISQSKILLDSLNSRLRVVWIPTKEMEDYADGPSRGKYIKAEFGLTEAGINKIIELFPSFQKRRNNTDLVSLFAAPCNNPANIRYFSLDIDATDPLSAGMDAFQAIHKKKLEGGRLAGGLMAYPPLALINSFNRIVREVGLEEDSELYYILPSKYVAKTVNMLSGIGDVQVKLLCGKSNSSILYKKPQHMSMSIINFSSLDLRRVSSAKRICLH